MLSITLLFSFFIGCTKSSSPEVAEPTSVSPPIAQPEGCESEEHSQELMAPEADKSSCTDVPDNGSIQSSNQPPQEGNGRYVIKSIPWSTVTIFATDTTKEISGNSPISGNLPAGDYEGSLQTADGKKASFSITIKKDGTSSYCWNFQRESECQL